MTSRVSLDHAIHMVIIVRSSIQMRAGILLIKCSLKVLLVVDIDPTIRAIERTGVLLKYTPTISSPAVITMTISKKRKITMTTKTGQGQVGAVVEVIVASHCKTQLGKILTAISRLIDPMELTLIKGSLNSSVAITIMIAWAVISRVLGESLRSRTWVEVVAARAR